VDPIHIFLTPKSTSALLTVHNDSPEQLRLQVSIFAWDESPKGEAVLKPTQDIIFFPALLTLGAGEERKVRVGSATPFAASEKTYRIIVEEMPPPPKAKQEKKDVNIRVLTRMSIPIFLQPPSTKTDPALVNFLVSHDKFLFQLKNGGNAHTMVRKAWVRATSAEGRLYIDEDLRGWYLLAGGRREYEVKIPKESCREIRSFAVHVELDTGKVEKTFETPKGACGS
jgi:fimbrial chaperone protein